MLNLNAPYNSIWKIEVLKINKLREVEPYGISILMRRDTVYPPGEDTMRRQPASSKERGPSPEADHAGTTLISDLQPPEL